MTILYLPKSSQQYFKYDIAVTLFRALKFVSRKSIFTSGVNPAVPIGTEVYYGCQNEWVFKSDWYMQPIIKIQCMETGVFSKPDVWPVCIDRKKSCSLINVFLKL